MFHDRTLQHAQLVTMAFDLNANACKLALLVQWYKDRGEKTLPVSYLKRLGFTRRQWELATKGSRVRVDGKLPKDAPPARDGLEATGMISEHREWCPRAEKTVTFWVIGDVTKEVLDAIRAEREAEHFNVIDDDLPRAVQQDEIVEPSVVSGSQTATEAAYDRGYADGEAAGYDRGVRDLETALDMDGPGCRKATPIVKSSRDVAFERLASVASCAGQTPAFLSQGRSKMALPGNFGLCHLLEDYVRSQSEPDFGC